MANQLPGRTTGRTVQGRQILRDSRNARHEGGVIDSDYAYDGSNTGYETELRAGCLMAVITGTKKYVPVKRTVVNGAHTSGDTTIVVDNSAFFKAGDTITFTGASEVTIDSIDYATHTITLTAGIDANVADDAACVASGALAGAETAVAILDEFVAMKDKETQVVADRASGKLLIQGFVLDAMLLGDVTAARAATNQLGLIHFQDQYQV